MLRHGVTVESPRSKEVALTNLIALGGKVLHTFLSDDAEARLQEALDVHAAA